jgi:hypothetical protein
MNRTIEVGVRLSGLAGVAPAASTKPIGPRLSTFLPTNGIIRRGPTQ